MVPDCPFGVDRNKLVLLNGIYTFTPSSTSKLGNRVSPQLAPHIPFSLCNVSKITAVYTICIPHICMQCNQSTMGTQRRMQR